MGSIALVLATSAGADSLNKCIDAQGQVTYSNLPCRNAREVRAVEIDPIPLPDPIKPPVRAKDALTDKLGTVFDKMDQARRKGYTQEQMNKWNQEIKSLETKKQQSGCF
ncbi:MAG: hypothetical protein B7X81_05215 [Hydrogenophilales bacterium 17-61-76]|nr:MAG: hypothetical protein B7X81_05215 [Hydrogenophilales bacterium 17-61-76]